MFDSNGMSLLARAGAFAQSVDVLDAIDGLSVADFRTFVTNTNPFEQTNALLGDVLFPRADTESLDFAYVMGGSNAAVMAEVTSHLGEAPIVGRQSPGTKRGSIPAIKQKRLLDAETLIRLQTARGAALQQAVDAVFNDTLHVRRAVMSTIEFLRMQALAYGIATLDFVGVVGAFDYGVPAAQKETLAGTALWSDPAARPLADIERWQNVLSGNRGNIATAMVTSSAVANAIRSHETVRRAIGGVNYDRRVTLADLNALLTSDNLPSIVTYDQTVQRIQPNGTRLPVRFYPKNRLTLVPALGGIGTTLTAPTAEEAVQGVADGRIAIDAARVAVHTYLASQDPKGLMTLGVGSLFPSFEAAEDVFQAQVLAA